MSYKLGLIGGKLGHSFSKIIHEYIFRKENIDASYSLMEVTIEEIPEVLSRIRKGELHAINVTIPYKQEVMKYLDEISPEAKKIGAVNTVVMKNGKLMGFNTDYYGFLNEVKYFNADLRGRKVHLLGCGGAAKAMANAILDLGGDLEMAIRREDLALSDWYDKVCFLDELDEKDIDVVCNATPVGMYPCVDAMCVSEDVAKRINLCFDAIYNPAQTKIMSYAKEAYNGLYMLILQAIKADEIFFDIVIDDVDDIIDYVKGVV